MFDISPFGDCAVHVQLGKELNKSIFERVQGFCAWLNARPDEGISEVIPGYLAVTLLLKPGTSPGEIRQYLTGQQEEIEAWLLTAGEGQGRVVEIPVCYGEAFGPDLEYVSHYHGLSPSEVIDLHTGQDYLVHMLGFMPGFAYMGGLAEQLATPRLATPRSHVPKGSVGIAGQQTGIYPLDSPGGWQIIGRTPHSLFNPDAEPPTLLQSGDRVRFRAVTKEEYLKLACKKN